MTRTTRARTKKTKACPAIGYACLCDCPTACKINVVSGSEVIGRDFLPTSGPQVEIRAIRGDLSRLSHARYWYACRQLAELDLRGSTGELNRRWRSGYPELIRNIPPAVGNKRSETARPPCPKPGAVECRRCWYRHSAVTRRADVSNPPIPSVISSFVQCGGCDEYLECREETRRAAGGDRST